MSIYINKIYYPERGHCFPSTPSGKWHHDTVKQLGNLKTPFGYQVATPSGTMKIQKTVNEAVQDVKESVVQMAKKLDGAIGGKDKGYPDIGSTRNGGPDFEGTPYLYPIKDGQKNIVRIEMVGNRGGDFKAANEKAGFPDAGRESPDTNYTWHHLDDFDPATGTCSMQLVKRKVHEATFPHNGSCSQYDKYHGEKSYNKPKKKNPKKKKLRGIKWVFHIIIILIIQKVVL